jgi:hypothetical protein
VVRNLKLKELLNKFNIKLKFTVPFMEAEIEFSDADKDAAWEMYIELMTRCATRKLKDDEGDNQEALDSLHELFGITREILKKYKCNCVNFSKIAISVLNQHIRPFVSKWHKYNLDNQPDVNSWGNFREELAELQTALKGYTALLADMAGVEDFSNINDDI